MQGADDTGGATAGSGHGRRPRHPERPHGPQDTRPVRPAGSTEPAVPAEPADPAAPARPAGAPPLPPELGPLHGDDPRTVGPYRLVGRLGAGGMGAVYGGLDERGRCLAVKTVHARHAADPGFRAGFAREVDLLRRAGGVCTAAVHAADPEAPSPWMAFDFIPGRNLRTHIRQIGPLRGPMLRAFAAGTAEALAAFHAVGIVHRDIKPGNVILAPDGPKVVDFGIAAAADEDPTDDPSASYGTPGWIAPERYRGAAPAAAVDVFAWGCLVAMAATGREPFGKGTPAELQERVLNAGPDLDGVPADLLPLVERALAKTPRQRPAALEAFAELVGAGAGAEAAAAADSRVRDRGAAVAGSVVRPDGHDGHDGPPDGEPGRTAETAFGAAPPAERLRALLREHWRNVDAGWHSPELWAAAAGTGAAAVAAAGVGAVAGAGTAAGGAGTAGGTSGAAGGAGAAGA
ncbi:serine/threonine-protein kinase, partial [Streptomonospora sediminis]